MKFFFWNLFFFYIRMCILSQTIDQMHVVFLSLDIFVCLKKQHRENDFRFKNKTIFRVMCVRQLILPCPKNKFFLSSSFALVYCANILFVCVYIELTNGSIVKRLVDHK